tara:strand:- start:798 stop:902 length:105 start_codon:yes stop_codon:yes gene_type:complete
MWASMIRKTKEEYKFSETFISIVPSKAPTVVLGK